MNKIKKKLNFVSILQTQNVVFLLICHTNFVCDLIIFAFLWSIFFLYWPNNSQFATLHDLCSPCVDNIVSTQFSCLSHRYNDHTTHYIIHLYYTLSSQFPFRLDTFEHFQIQIFESFVEWHWIKLDITVRGVYMFSCFTVLRLSVCNLFKSFTISRALNMWYVQ